MLMKEKPSKLVTALVVASGQGQRMGGDFPKQYHKIAGKEVLRHTVEKLLSFQSIAQVRVVIDPAHKNLFDEAINGLNVGDPIEGGGTRQQSVYNGLMALDPCDFVLIHDAVRPFIPTHLVHDLLEALRDQEAVIPAIEVSDTLKVVKEGVSQGTQSRTGLWRAQTPQGFHFEKIKAAHMILSQSEGLTDDASIFEALGWPVSIIKGHAWNRKITYPADLSLMEALLNHEKQNEEAC